MFEAIFSAARLLCVSQVEACCSVGRGVGDHGAGVREHPEVERFGCGWERSAGGADDGGEARVAVQCFSTEGVAEVCGSSWITQVCIANVHVGVGTKAVLASAGGGRGVGEAEGVGGGRGHPPM